MHSSKALVEDLSLSSGPELLTILQGLVVFATINTLLQTTSAAQPGSVLSFPGFWATAAVLGLTVTIAWGGYGCVLIYVRVLCCTGNLVGLSCQCEAQGRAGAKLLQCLQGKK